MTRVEATCAAESSKAQAGARPIWAREPARYAGLNTHAISAARTGRCVGRSLCWESAPARGWGDAGSIPARPASSKSRWTVQRALLQVRPATGGSGRSCLDPLPRGPSTFRADRSGRSARHTRITLMHAHGRHPHPQRTATSAALHTGKAIPNAGSSVTVRPRGAGTRAGAACACTPTPPGKRVESPATIVIRHLPLLLHWGALGGPARPEYRSRPGAVPQPRRR